MPKVLGQELELSIVKNDQPLRLWCLAGKGYTDPEINALSAKQAWQEAQTIAHQLRESQWDARAKGELGIIAFLEGDSRRAATMVHFRRPRVRGTVTDTVRLLLFLVGYIVLMRWVLPRLRVPT